MEFPDKNTPQAPKKDIKPVISGAVPVNRPASKRFFGALFAESPKEILAKVGRDVLVPRFKMGVEEAFNNFLGGMLWGDSSARPLPNTIRATQLRGGGTNYAAISSGNLSALQQAQQQTTNRSHGNYQDLVCPTQQTAEVLLANMYDLLRRYNVVAVGDLYELAGLPVNPSDNAYGWMSLEGARISKVREGYLLELPLPNLV